MNTPDLAEAMRLIRETERTNPEAIARLEMARVCENVPFYRDARTMHHGPSLGGVDPRNSAVIEATARSHAAMLAREQVDYERQAEHRAKAAEILAAGQSPANSAIIKRQVRGAGG